MSLKATNNVGTNSYELEIEIPAKDFEDALQKAYLRAKKNIALPGFRKGKAPRKLIEKTYGEEVFYEDAINLLYAPVVNGAIDESKLDLVCQPEIEVTEINKENGVKLKAKCTTRPEVEVKDYKGIEVEKVVNAVTDEDIQKKLDELREKNVRIITVDDRAAETGDTVKIDFEGFKDGVAFDGGKAEDFDLELGSGQFIPGFEDQIVGHSTGEEFEINVTFPEEYQVKDLAGAPAVFKINLKSISKKELPELDDDMVKDSTDFDTVDEYKADVKAKLEEAAEKAADTKVEGDLFDKVVENMTAEIPDVMYDNRVNEMVAELEQRMASQGISLDMYMQFTGQNIDTIKKGYAEQAEKQVKLRLALEKVAEVENIEVTDDDIENEFKKLAETYNMEVEQVKSYVRAEDLKKDLAVGKAVDIIKDSAVIK
ncbi:trigger factor [Ruminococcus albus]|uniref:Trigger factor n=1 Tax=Ruminococcus albus (strain ATCC 27210 / DSM 20455 / JCM 14654 / NCDO 2250 / 7) TaxID=697329 RepID=E6UKI3_RUMA7|nr:trigger factor [Ruminococcus albus]ADU24179.1 trigger factor [Ruminococcus albus 7 = DSM 20455]